MTSGQWMTERRGGSDVAQGTDTTAEAVPSTDGASAVTHRLHGLKWFTSATDSEMAITLARPRVDGSTREGNRGLAMFFVWTRHANGALNGIEVQRLKNKLGTKQLPTAEML